MHSGSSCIYLQCWDPRCTTAPAGTAGAPCACLPSAGTAGAPCTCLLAGLSQLMIWHPQCIDHCFFTAAFSDTALILAIFLFLFFAAIESFLCVFCILTPHSPYVLAFLGLYCFGLVFVYLVLAFVSLCFNPITFFLPFFSCILNQCYILFWMVATLFTPRKFLS